MRWSKSWRVCFAALRPAGADSRHDALADQLAGLRSCLATGGYGDGDDPGADELACRANACGDNIGDLRGRNGHANLRRSGTEQAGEREPCVLPFFNCGGAQFAIPTPRGR